MSILAVKNDSAGNLIDTLHEKIIYITRASAAMKEYIYGAGVSEINAYAEMCMVKECWNQEEGKAYYHYILSPENWENPDPDTLFQASIEIAEYISHFCGRYQVLAAIHFNIPDNIHTHFIVNNIDLETGKRMNLNKQCLYALKQRASEILKSHGISPIRQYVP